MEKLEFFEGERTVDSFVLKLYGGKAQLRCAVIERWVERIGRSINCGRSRKFLLKKILGVSSVERQELEAKITSSLGLKGISELKSEVRSKIGHELRLEETQEEQEEFSFEAPKCGRRALQVYQLQRLYEFSYEDNRYWLKRWLSSTKNFTKTIAEWLNRFYDSSMTLNHDPECKCTEKQPDENDGLINLIFGNIRILTGYKKSENGIVFSDLNLLIPAGSVEELLYANITFERSMIPPYLLFLTGERSHKLTAQVLPHRGVSAEYQRAETSYEDFSPERRERQASGPATTNLITLLLGGSIGAILALLFAPKPGAELRGDIADATRKGIDKSREAATYIGGKAGDYYGAVRDDAGEWVGGARDAALQKRGQVSAAIEAGRQAYNEEKRRTELSDPSARNHTTARSESE